MDALYRGLSVAVAIIVPVFYFAYREAKKDNKLRQESKERLIYYAKRINESYTEEKVRALFDELYYEKKELHKSYADDLSRCFLILRSRMDLFNYLKDNPLT